MDLLSVAMECANHAPRGRGEISEAVNHQACGFVDQKLGETAMKNNIVLGFVLVMLVYFGLRGVLPEIFDSLKMSVLIAFVLAGIGGFVIGRYTSRRETQGHT
jgi:hypothetical protein